MTDPTKQARVTIQAHAAPLPETAKSAGAPDPSQTISVSVITRRCKALDLAALDGRVLTHEEFMADYAADSADFDAIRAFAHEHGLTVDESRSDLARRTIVLAGPVSRMESAFGVTLQRYQHDDTNIHFHVYQGSLTVPAELEGRVEAVLGLDTRPIAKSHMRRRTGDGNIIRANAVSESYNPPQVAELYDFPTELNGAGQCIGILELGGGYEASDIKTYFSNLGLKPPTVVAVSVDGGTNVPGGDPSGADGEVALDIQVAGAVAPGAKIAVYFTPNTDQGFIDAITTAVHDATNKPKVLSISWGGPESSWSAESRTSLDNACQSAAALGVTITVASGDNGSSDGSSGNNVDFPASSPHVLACGGTQLVGSGSTIKSEVVWNDQSEGGGATGGGVSTVFALPSWQANAKVPKPSGSKGGRGVPDVAGDAAPETGYNVLVDGQQQVVGGTSAVAPLWAGLLTLVNQARVASGAATAGFVNPQLYAEPSALRDITSGGNGTYKAATGWDPCTGLGSPKGAAVLEALGGGSASGSGSGTGTGTGTGTGSTGTPSDPPEHKKKKHHHHD